MKGIKKCIILLFIGMLAFAGLGFGTHSAHRAEAAVDGSYDLKLMTFNIRNGGAGEAGDWDIHKDVVVRAIDSFGPDVLGMQEGHQSGIAYLLNNLNEQYEYDSIGTSRFGNTEDEYNNIVYRSDKFDVVQSGQFWLSDYPDVVGSKSIYDPAYPRMCTWAKFRAKDDPKAEFYYFNTHFGLTAGAQSQGASVILDQIAKYVISPDVPVFVGGDLNVQENSQAFQTLQNSSLDDTWAGAGHVYTDDDGTYSDFNGSTNTGHIDWIFQRNVSQIQSIEINRYNEDGLYPSDHYPVQLAVAIPLTGRVGTTVPSAPRDVYSASGEDLTKVIFAPSPDDGGSEVLQYKVTVLRDGTIVKTVVGGASPISITGLDADGEYTFNVTAVNAVGESVPSAPSKPISELANLSLGKPYLSVAVSSNQLLSGTITITPTSAPADEQEYALYWGDAGGKLSGVQPIATIPASGVDVIYTFDKTPVPPGATKVLVYTRILGYDSTLYAGERLPTAGVQPVQIEDFTDVSDWTDLRYGKITAVDGIGLISVDGPVGRAFGYAGIPVTYNLTDLPILRVKIDSLDEGAMWALKLHTKPNQGSGDIKIQGDTNKTGEFNFDLRKATGWNGEKSFIIKLFPIGVAKSFRISELSVRPAVELGDDEAPPTTTAVLEGLKPNNWYASSVSVHLSAKDEESSVTGTVYSLDGGTTWKPYLHDLIFEEDGVYTLTFRSIDSAGNEEQPQMVTFSIDRTAPDIQISGGRTYTIDQTVTVTCTASDTVSGLVYNSCSAPLMNGPAYLLNVGENRVTAYATDAAGNTGSASTTVTVKVTLASLTQLIKDWNASSSGDQGIAGSLVNKLQHGQFKAFINEVQAQKGKKINEEDANLLIKYVHELQ